MDQKLLYQTIEELRERKQQIDQVILMLETLGAGKPRRGRPPKLLAQAMAAINKSASKESAARRTGKVGNHRAAVGENRRRRSGG